KLESLAHQLGITSKVIFLGSAPHSDIPRLLNAADIFCRPSRSEGFGNSFIEAMASGLPVIAPLVGGIADFLIDNKNGIVCQSENSEDLAEKILLLAHDKELRAVLIDGGKTTAERYDWDAITESYSRIFYDV